MTIDDLKTLMDDFDPASLFPKLESVTEVISSVLRIAVLIGPVILLVMGLLYLLVSPREANYYLGYRCYFGMGSEEAWRFSQRLAGLVWVPLGLVLTIVMASTGKNFATLAADEAIWLGVKCVLWEAGLTALSCLVINCVVAFWFDRQGQRRRRARRK